MPSIKISQINELKTDEQKWRSLSSFLTKCFGSPEDIEALEELEHQLHELMSETPSDELEEQKFKLIQQIHKACGKYWVNFRVNSVTVTVKDKRHKFNAVHQARISVYDSITEKKGSIEGLLVWVGSELGRISHGRDGVITKEFLIEKIMAVGRAYIRKTKRKPLPKEVLKLHQQCPKEVRRIASLACRSGWIHLDIQHIPLSASAAARILHEAYHESQDKGEPDQARYDVTYME